MQVSVIIASYNYGHLVGEAIRSVQEQTFHDLEIIVVDDGSTDDTQEVLASIQEPRLRVKRIPNGGESVARNTAMEWARGKYLAFLDADDRWRPTKLERQVEMMESEPDLGLTFTNFLRFGPDGYFPNSQFDFIPQLLAVPNRQSREGGGHVITADAFTSLIGISNFTALPTTVMVRADRVRGIDFPPGMRLCADLHYMLRVYARVTAGYITESLAEVRRHGTNSYSSLSEISEAAAGVFQDMERESLTADQRAIARRQAGWAWVGIGYQYYHRRLPRAAAAAAIRALRFPGSRMHALKRLALLPAMPVLADPSKADWGAAPASEIR
jgi:glycosyltransferase involved in cell wall biosynthesis